MKSLAVYCCPHESKGPEHAAFAERFVSSWLSAPPGADVSLIVISNGGPPSVKTQVLFSSIPQFSIFIEWNDQGWDIGGFQHVANSIACDLILMFGGNAYLKRAGWMQRILEVWETHGAQLYGAFGCTVHKPHIRTTGFWMPPQLFRRYPKTIATMEDRYAFEHRDNNLTEFAERIGYNALSVTWSGVWSKEHWRNIPNAYGNGNHSECLFGDRISDMIQPVK
jgi:hypothetical protein